MQVISRPSSRGYGDSESWIGVFLVNLTSCQLVLLMPVVLCPVRTRDTLITISTNTRPSCKESLNHFQVHEAFSSDTWTVDRAFDAKEYAFGVNVPIWSDDSSVAQRTSTPSIYVLVTKLYGTQLLH